MRYVLGFVFVLCVSVIDGSPECSSYDFPCENGECIDAALWCDTQEDCSDGTDEKYCKKAGFLSSNPNKCPSTYFKCDYGPCIPKSGRCDGYNNCDDLTDEKDCAGDAESSSEENAGREVGNAKTEKETKTSSTTARTTTTRATKKAQTLNKKSSPSSSDKDSFEIEFSPELKTSDFSRQREKALDWLLSQRQADFGWGDETPRALTALFLSLQSSKRRKETDLLMVKQLEVHLTLEMARNSTKPMQLADLALYVNALLASCRNPKNFYGDNLVRMLRNSVDAAHRQATFVSPSVYLTLCVNNATVYEDVRKLHDIFLTRNSAIGRMDIQALALLTATCIFRNNEKLLTSTIYDGFRKQFSNRMNANGSPGNVYEAALLLQALQEMKVTQTGLVQFVRKQQKEDGSFGGILATYLVLPALAGRSFIQMNEHCNQRHTTDLAPIEVLKNTKRRRIFVQYSLNYGFPLELTQSIHMQVAEGISFLDVMRLAQEVNPKYRFMLDGSGDIPIVYSIGGIPNDAEKGMFWTLHVASNTRVQGDSRRLVPYSGNIKNLVPHPGDEFIFWMKSM